jgi:hypothetical protein
MDLALREEYSIKFCTKLIVVISPDIYYSQFYHPSNEAVLHSVKEKRNILHTVRRRKATWIGHILRRNCLLSHIIEGKIIGTRRRGRRRK